MSSQASWSAQFRNWLGDRSGQFATILGILSPIALGLVGGVVDMVVFVNHHSELQSTADAAVLAVAREASLKGWNAGTAEEVAGAIVKGTLSNTFGTQHTFTLTLDQKARRVEMDLEQDHYGYFFIGYFAGSPQIRVSAAAFASGVSTVCIIVQSPSQPESLVVSGKSRVQAPGCAAYSNSKDAKGINVKDVSLLGALMTCSAGGFGGKSGNFTRLPITDCPAIADPLAARAKLIDAALPTGCDYGKIEVKGGQKTLKPGRYCKEIRITEGAAVQFEPGIYVVGNSKLKVEKGAKISGAGVGLVFTGKDAELNLSHDSSVSLSAPASGVMAGILMYGQPSAAQRKFSIVSRDAQSLTGTVYLPGDVLTVGGDDDLDGTCDPIGNEDDEDDDDDDDDGGSAAAPDPTCLSDVGNASDWTAIIARQVRVTAGSTLVMNSNYEGSDVPVPDGIGPSSARVVLAK